MVLIPEKMAILDTERALKMFSELGIEMAGLIVNQVYPVELLDKPDLSPFLRNRIEMQQAHLRDIDRKFGDRVVAQLGMYPREPKGLDLLERVAHDLLGGQR
jgi:arsenite-transporting ATPase